MAEDNPENIRILNERGEELNSTFRDVNAEVNSLFEQLNSISDEINNNNNGYKLARQSVGKLVGIFGRIKDIQEDITQANSSDLKTLQSKVISEKKNIIESQKLLLLKRGTNEFTQKDQVALDNINGLLKTQNGLYNDITKTLNDVVKLEESVEKTMGSLGAATEGLSGGLKKAGLGALDTKLGLGEALNNTKNMVKENGGNVSKMKAAGHLAKQLGSNLLKALGPIAIITFIVEQVIKAFVTLYKVSVAIAKNFGVFAEEVRKLNMERSEFAN